MFLKLRDRSFRVFFGGVAALAFLLMLTSPFRMQGQDQDLRAPALLNALKMVNEGRRIFRFDTFGDEVFWGGQLKLHEAIAGATLGGVGSGLSPRAALDLGLKVDVDALPSQVIQRLRTGDIDINSPATT